ncbi:DUF4383 domain-containing protein [Kribbella deserti]|uniref:DUF4383 domain-containing protein n=1 Tax=Kribbella deserti TaxID=1926257 RepID=A0ABV6QHR0_9ACTN
MALNLLHLVLGLWAFVAARQQRTSIEYLIANGVISLSMHVYGASPLAELLAWSPPARWMHLALTGLTITLAVRSIAHHRDDRPNDDQLHGPRERNPHR